MSMLVHRIAPILVLVALLAPAGLADPVGILSGRVTDGVDALPGVLVTAMPRQGGGAHTTVTDAAGRYRLLLPAGRWDVSFELEGFNTLLHSGVVVTAGGDTTCDATLDLASVAEEILVTGTRATPAPMGNATATVPLDVESYDPIEENRFLDPFARPLSTWAIDVDSASLANVRRFLEDGEAPPRDAVRIEELLNAFPEAYAYPEPTDGHPFSVSLAVAEAPWQPGHRLVRIGLRGRTVPPEERPPANLVFLVDVSGSMEAPDKLPWVKRALQMLTEQLQPRDQVAIVVYAGAAGLVLEPTSARDRWRILDALERLEAGGSTNGGEGIQLAYLLARDNAIEGGINRVVLATDGDWNVGVTDEGGLVELVRRQAAERVSLSVLGFGTGNLKDDLLEQLADDGDGNYAYVDSLAEARRVLVEQLGATLHTIAREVKVQVELNPATVARYRLIGYENRLLDDEDFEDDQADGGEIGAGHTVTALYEIVPRGQPVEVGDRELRYQSPATLREAAHVGGELLTVSLRYQHPDGGPSILLERSLLDPGSEPPAMREDFRFAAGLAAFGLMLRNSPFRGSCDWDMVRELLESGPAIERRSSLLELVQRASELVVPENEWVD